MTGLMSQMGQRPEASDEEPSDEEESDFASFCRILHHARGKKPLLSALDLLKRGKTGETLCRLLVLFPQTSVMQNNIAFC